MARSMIAGMTDYSNQSFEDMILDLEEWIQNLKEVAEALPRNVQRLKELQYWEKVDPNFQGLVGYSIKFFETSIKEFSDIVKEIKQEVRVDHVTRIRGLCKTAIDLDFDYGRIWHQKYQDKEYGDTRFSLVEGLYQQGRLMAIDMRDLCNLADRINDFVGKKSEQKPDAMDMLELKPNFFGMGINLNELINKFFRKKG